eukprot:300353_1
MLTFAAIILSLYVNAISGFNQTEETVHITHCNNECGTVNGCHADNENGIGASEGVFGTRCSCPGGVETTPACTLPNGVKAYYCNDKRTPDCSGFECGQTICLNGDGHKVNGYMVTACPKNHPNNVQQCCAHKDGGDWKNWCQCLIGPDIDIASNLTKYFGSNTVVSATKGGC